MAESGVALKEGESADSHELMDAGVASDEHVVLYGGVASNQRAVGQDDVVADLGVMADVAASHKQVVGANGCGFLLGVGAVNGDVFPENVARTDDRLGRLAGVAGILGRITEDASGMEDVGFSQFGLSREVNLGADPTTVANFDFPVDHGARADGDVFAKFDFGANDGCGMEHKGLGTGLNLLVKVSPFSQGAKVFGSVFASASDDDVIEDFDLEQLPRPHEVAGYAKIVLGRGWIAAWMIVR